MQKTKSLKKSYRLSRYKENEMIGAQMIRDAEQRRLAWRCRRGMLELDIVLERFVKEQFHLLTLDEMDAFDELLSLPDNAFWALIQSAKQHKNTAINSVIDKLNMTSISGS